MLLDIQDEALKNRNHPKKGSRIKVDPIRKPSAIKAIKRMLRKEYRNLALFTLGINTGYRATELLSLKVGQVNYLEAGDTLEIYQTKTKKYRSVVLNKTCIDVLQNWIKHGRLRDCDPLFKSHKGSALQVPSVNNLVKKWCSDIGLHGNFGSHSLRKTWGYHQRKYNNTPLPVLMFAFGHSNQKQTLDYLGLQTEEVTELFKYEI